MEVIFLNHKKGTSFAYSNGLYAIAKEYNGSYHMAKINADGKINKYPDGDPSIVITGIGNKAITRTSLVCNEKLNYK